MDIKEYSVEHDKPVKLKNGGWVPAKEYKIIHESSIVLCHDAIIQHGDGFLLVKRKNHPAKDHIWPIGGRVIRGMPILDSLALKIKQECGLNIKDAVFVGASRTKFQTDPFSHGKGTDTLNLMYIVLAEGKLKLDFNHEEPVYLTLENHKNLSESLHPYVRDFCNLAIKYL